jgi:hypothetical protein
MCTLADLGTNSVRDTGWAIVFASRGCFDRGSTIIKVLPLLEVLPVNGPLGKAFTGVLGVEFLAAR